MTTITADFFQRVALPSSSAASGTTSKTINRYLEETRTAATEAASSLPARAFAALARVARECASPGWDGYDAAPISQGTCDRTRAFLNELPIWMPAPDIVPEADGEIAIEWYVGPHQVFSISIGAAGPLHFAGLFGQEDELHGVKSFDGSIAQELVQHIEKLLRAPPDRRGI